MSYRVEELISDTGKCKVWKTVFPRYKTFSRNAAVAKAATLKRTGLGRIRIRRNRTTPKPKGGDTK